MQHYFNKMSADQQNVPNKMFYVIRNCTAQVGLNNINKLKLK